MYKSLLKKINENVIAFPDHVVIIDEGDNNYYDFKTLDSYARLIAGKLVRLGVGRRDFVTIELPRNKEYVAAMYAVWIVGAAFAPLSDAYPP